MQRWPLYPHPLYPASAVRAVHASLSATDAGPQATFQIEAELAALRWPAAAAPAFRDRLWRHSCLELFAADTAQAYREFNFSPSSEFAAYGFDAYRSGMRALQLGGEPAIHWREEPACIRVDIRLPAGWLLAAPAAQPRAVGLAAVLEQRDGSVSYWALRHSGPKPDFHHRDGFIAGWPPARE